MLMRRVRMPKWVVWLGVKVGKGHMCGCIILYSKDKMPSSGIVICYYDRENI